MTGDDLKLLAAVLAVAAMLGGWVWFVARSTGKTDANDRWRHETADPQFHEITKFTERITSAMEQLTKVTEDHEDRLRVVERGRKD